MIGPRSPLNSDLLWHYDLEPGSIQRYVCDPRCMFSTQIYTRVNDALPQMNTNYHYIEPLYCCLFYKSASREICATWSCEVWRVWRVNMGMYLPPLHLGRSTFLPET